MHRGAKLLANTYLRRMFKLFDFCIPTRATIVPDSPDWLHEVKYDGYRLRVERDGDRVRLITRGGYNWTDRYPWIVEAALKNRQERFVIDGEDLRALPLSMRKTTLARLLARRPDGIFVAPFEQGEIGPDLFRAACDMGPEGTGRSGRIDLRPDGRSTG